MLPTEWLISFHLIGITHQELQDQIQTLEIQISEHIKADYEYQNTVAIVISVAHRAKTIFDNSFEPARKRQFFNYILQDPAINEKKLYFSITSPYNLVLDLAMKPTWLRTLNEIRTFFSENPNAEF